MPKYQLAAEAAEVLADLKTPIERAALLRKYGARSAASAQRVAEIWDALETAGLLRETEATEQSSDLVAAFGGWRAQRGLLADASRVTAFARAIKALVRPGDRVIDVGAGSGILSLLAARAGAGQVDALEATAIVDDARAIVEANGLGERIRFVAGDATDFVAAARADLVMGEWAGMLLFEEWRHFDAFARVRDRNLRTGGAVLPVRASISLSPIDDARLYVERGPGFWERPIGGFDFRLVHERQLDRTRRIIVQASKHTLLKPVEILRVDCKTEDSRAFAFEHAFEHTFAHSATCHGFVGYFELELAPEIVLDTSPFAPDTHWHQSYFPMEQLQIRSGDTLAVRVKSAPDEFVGTPVLTIAAQLHRAGQAVAVQQRTYTLEDTQG